MPSLPVSILSLTSLSLLLAPGSVAYGETSSSTDGPAESSKAGKAKSGKVLSVLPQLAQTGAIEGTPLNSPEAVVEAYRNRGEALLWFEKRGLAPSAMAFIKGLKGFEQEGLPSERYHRETLEAALRRRPRGKAMPRFDILLTDAFLTLSQDMASGRVDPSSIGHFSGIEADSIDLDSLLTSVLHEGRAPLEVVDSLRPQHPQYAALVEARQRIAGLRDAPWAPIQSGAEVSLGTMDPRIPQVASRLALLGELYNPKPATQCEASEFPEFDWELYSSPSTTQTTLDQALTIALLRFQGHRGLEETGTLNDETITELNKRPDTLLKDIDSNLERWRWLPEDLGERYVWINIPTFDLVYHEADSEDLTMAVVVGRTDRQTPELVSTLTSVQLNPTWTVTPNIASRDILPRVKADPTYLARKKMVLYDGWTSEAEVVEPASVDWSTVSYRDIRAYRIVQLPGPSNALGTLKLRFDNDYSVYMHDTDHRNLFSRDIRTFSSGCVRLDQPLALATRILDDNGYSMDEIEALLQRDDPVNISLKYDPAVYITYFTAIVDSDGALSLLPDYYGRDDGLLSELEETTYSGDGKVAP